MRARATSRKRGWCKRLAALLLGGALLTGFLAAPAEAAKTTHASAKPGKKKVHRPSKAHLKIKADLAKAKADDPAGGSELGAASFYGFGFHGRRVATGERFDARALTAASNRYPLGSWVAVRRLDSDRCVMVRINDRMHTHHRTRIIDLSRGAAQRLQMISAGVVLVRVLSLAQAPEEMSEAACLANFAAELPAPPVCENCDPTPGEQPALPAGTMPAEEG